MSHRPTPQQQDAIDEFSLGGSLSVQALAGTGKTSTLVEMAATTRSRGQYVAFNKSIVLEAQRKFADYNVDASTIHSLAFQSVGRRLAHRLNDRRKSTTDIAEILGLDLDTPWVFDRGEDTIEIPAQVVASHASRAVQAFCQTADRELSARHVPFLRSLDDPNEFNNNFEFGLQVLPLAQAIWGDVTRESGDHQFKHEHYLKLWHLEGPILQADYILFDEAQDANPLMLDVVRMQTETQIVLVGDSNQQIYEWNGAVNAMESAEGKTFYLTKSFRFGPEIAEAANEVLRRLGSPLLEGAGLPGRVGVVDSPDVALGRTNAAVVEHAFREMDRGRKVALVGGTDQVVRFANAAKDLQNGRPTYHPELACFRSWDEVNKYVEEDELGVDLKQMVSLVNEFSPQTIIDRLGATSKDETEADVVVSTAHKSKGREWPKVELLSDYPIGLDVTPQDLRLLYVAASRAESELDATGVDLTGTASTRAQLEAARFDALLGNDPRYKHDRISQVQTELEAAREPRMPSIEFASIDQAIGNQE